MSTTSRSKKDDSSACGARIEELEAALAGAESANSEMIVSELMLRRRLDAYREREVEELRAEVEMLRSRLAGEE